MSLRSSTSRAWSLRQLNENLDGVTAVGKSAGEARPPGFAKHSTTTELEVAESSGEGEA